MAGFNPGEESGKLKGAAMIYAYILTFYA